MADDKKWTGERIELLRHRWREGASASAIANELACGLTRNAVLGKAHRMGIVIPGERTRNYGKTQIRRGRAPRKTRMSHAGIVRVSNENQRPVFETAPIPRQIVGDIGRIKFSELTETSCRFPEGDPQSPDFRFCGREKMPGSSYCPRCHSIAYVGPPPKKPRTSSQNRETIRVKIDA